MGTAARLAPPAGRVGRVLPGRRARGGRGHPHVRPRRAGEPGPGGRRLGRGGAYGGVVRSAVRLAGTHLRGRGAAGEARRALEAVRVQVVASAVLVGRTRATPRRAPLGLLQRDDHRHQTLVSYEFSLADIEFLGAHPDVIAEVDRLPLTSDSYLADVRTA